MNDFRNCIIIVLIIFVFIAGAMAIQAHVRIDEMETQLNLMVEFDSISTDNTQTLIDFQVMNDERYNFTLDRLSVIYDLIESNQSHINTLYTNGN